MTTLSKIVEQVKRLMTANPSINFSLTDSEIKLFVVQVLNKALKTERFNLRLPEGDYYPDSTLIAVYDNQQVVKYGAMRSSTLLPAYPLSLPKNMGVWEVSDMNNPDIAFIPLDSGVWSIMRSINPINVLQGQIGYEVVGRQIIYTQNLLMAAPAITKVRVKLLIVDLANLDNFQTLPIPPDMESGVIMQVFQIMQLQPNVDKVDNRADVKLKQ